MNKKISSANVTKKLWGNRVKLKMLLTTKSQKGSDRGLKNTNVEDLVNICLETLEIDLLQNSLKVFR